MLRVAHNDVKKDDIAFKGLDVVRQYAALLERRVQRSTRARKALVVTRQTNPLGRSMIEMLGVLAIIGVLSVGGIAGYSKAMEKWKIDKATEEYSHIIFGMLQHIDDVRKLSPQSGYTGLADLAIALNLIPNSWNKIGDKHFKDAYGNMVQVQARAENLVFDIFIGGIQSNNDSTSSPGWSPRLCESLISNLAQPLHSAVNIVNTWQSGKGGIYYRGDAYCGGNIPCVSNITLNNIHEMCKHCDGSRECCITLEF